ncbi:MAG: hypothetical protein NUV37_01195 [Nanoarchaeota archaeon]|nr:hypothetical protein [Nanoarchaeota archaeon]
MVKGKHSKTKQTILAIAIALIAVFFIAYAIQSFYPSPKYEDYCGKFDRPIEITNEVQCLELEGTWIPYAEKVPDGREGYCDFYTMCNEEYNSAKEPYEFHVFIINLFLGLIILILAFFLSVEAISTGFMGGGAILMIYGTIRYWSELSDVLRTIFLGIALFTLVFFGYKKLK